MKQKKEISRRIVSIMLALILLVCSFFADGSIARAYEGPMWVYGEWGVVQVWCEECNWGYTVDNVKDIGEVESDLDMYFCDGCGYCTIFGNAECYLEHHCWFCGDCVDPGDYCGGCYDEFNEVICDHCVQAFEGGAGIAHCPECNLHYSYETADKCNCAWSDEEPHCQDCHEESCEYCGDCLELAGRETYNLENGGCAEHSVCYDCLAAHAGKDGIHCGGCYSCDVDVCEECGMCEDCALYEEHCPECGYCFGSEGVKWCEAGGDHCIHCCEDNGWLCEQCEECTEGHGIEQCSDCGLCVDCCLDNSEAEGCTHGYCIESGEYEDHLCPECLRCPDDNECEYCGLCEDCVENYHCEHGICPDNDSEWDEHLCEMCGECFELDELCEYCHMCENCWEHCEHDMCPEDFDYYDHVCEQCGECRDDSEFCSDCGLCIFCCEENTEELGCEHGFCIKSDEFVKHWCYTDNQCLEKCNHGSCRHQALLVWRKNETAHWHVCKKCGITLDKAVHTAGDPVVVTAPDPIKRKNGTGKISCTECGQSMGTVIIPYVEIPKDGSPYILSEPKDKNTKVSDVNNEGIVRYVTFTVKAGGDNLSYQWYEYKKGRKPLEAVALSDGGDFYSWYDGSPDVSGAKTNSLTIAVPADSCYEDYQYYCVVKNSKGSVTSRKAKLDARHVYGWFLSDCSATHSEYCVGDGCGEVKKTEPHSFGDWELVKAASSTETGLKQQVCNDCGYIRKKTIPKVEENHVHVFDRVRSGLTNHWFECKCGVRSDAPAEDHIWGKPEVITAATELKEGEQKLTCTVCNFSKTEKTDKLPHTHVLWYVYDDPEKGGTDSNYHYTYCKSGDHYLEKMPHDNYEWYIYIQASADRLGVLQRKCETCGHTEKKYYFPGTYPIMVEGGKPDKDFAEPGETVTVTYTKSEGLKWGSGTFWKDMYDDHYLGSEFGLKQVNLSPGKYSSTVTFTMPDGPVALSVYNTVKCNHTNGTVMGKQVNPTCTAYGHKADTLCKDCGKVIKEGERLEALGHNLSDTPIEGTERVEYCSIVTSFSGMGLVVKTEPNENRFGYSGDFICKRCGETVAGQKTPLVHGAYDLNNKARRANNEPRWVGTKTDVRNAREASCTVDGYTGDTYCHYCETRIAKGEKTERLGHDWSEWTTVREATTKVKGMEERVCGWDESHVETRVTDYSGPDYSLKPDKAKIHFDYTYGEKVDPVIVTYRSTGRDEISKIEKVDLEVIGNGGLYDVKLLDDFRAEISIHDQAFIVSDGTEEYMSVAKVPETNLSGEKIAPLVEITSTVKLTPDKYNITVIGGTVRAGKNYSVEASTMELHGGESLILTADPARAKDFICWQVVKDDSGMIAAHLDNLAVWNDDTVYSFAMSPNDVVIRAVYKGDKFKVNLDVRKGKKDIAVSGITDGGSYLGAQTLTLNSKDTCRVYVTSDNETYTRCEAVNAGTDIYDFGFTVNSDITLIVARIGDVNFDGVVDSADALLVLRYDVGKAEFTDLQKLYADVNGDGKIDSADALLILRYDVGKANFSW